MIFSQRVLAVLLFPLLLALPSFAGKEFLTEKEIELIRDNYAIDARVKVFMEAAELRLKTAEERLTGTESAPGDPLEFFTPEDMLDGYYHILSSVMMNLDDAAQRGPRVGAMQEPKPAGTPQEQLGRALKRLRSGTEKAIPKLEILKKLAEEKRKEELWRLVNNAIEITQGAHEGAEYGLNKYPAPSDRKDKKK